ncbi:hypothetical protein CYMTET_23622 [Cymbomonas tetramitiformis]|uniref:Uncharacterized protein n=1 Tax=Cymbomonas tetramitiformis TaxID=36881 RepID=A0AAE0L129_9CHLO|nr:hypothetical protein CYMTET_23622 [Cymbomonas tetramitiformis]
MGPALRQLSFFALAWGLSCWWGEVAQRLADEGLALMNRAWEDAFEEMDYATQAGQDGDGDGTQESLGTQQSEQASGGTGEARRMAARLSDGLEYVRRGAECIQAAGGPRVAETQSS